MSSAAAYEKHGREFLRYRDHSSIGAKMVSRWAQTWAKGAEVLEIGCGGGFPITLELEKAGLRLWAIDSSPTLVEVFQSRFPEIPVACALVQETDFFNRIFDGAVAIGIVFLLSEPEQVEFIARIADILAPGGRFLFTAPLEAAKWRDRITGLACHSLGQAIYKKILREFGFRVIHTYQDEGDNNYYEAEKIG